MDVGHVGELRVARKQLRRDASECLRHVYTVSLCGRGGRWVADANSDDSAKYAYGDCHDCAYGDSDDSPKSFTYRDDGPEYAHSNGDPAAKSFTDRYQRSEHADGDGYDCSEPYIYSGSSEPYSHARSAGR
jgi:hypothetical protein